MEFSLKSFLYIILLFFVGLMCEKVLSTDADVIVVDGIHVRRSEQIKVRTEQKRNEEQVRIKDSLAEEDARLYNESKDITKHLPNNCQGLLTKYYCSV